jgi:hypothetical protein
MCLTDNLSGKTFFSGRQLGESHIVNQATSVPNFWERTGLDDSHSAYLIPNCMIVWKVLRSEMGDVSLRLQGANSYLSTADSKQPCKFQRLREIYFLCIF